MLLLFMLGATETARGPDVAPDGIVTTIEVSLQELIVIGLLLSITALPPADAPNPEPVMITWPPIDPVSAETLVITGPGAEAKFTDTLSKTAVARVVLLSLLTPNPT